MDEIDEYPGLVDLEYVNSGYGERIYNQKFLAQGYDLTSALRKTAVVHSRIEITEKWYRDSYKEWSLRAIFLIGLSTLLLGVALSYPLGFLPKIQFVTAGPAIFAWSMLFAFGISYGAYQKNWTKGKSGFSIWRTVQAQAGRTPVPIGVDKDGNIIRMSMRMHAGYSKKSVGSVPLGAVIINPSGVWYNRPTPTNKIVG